jgi:hypothetical protein
MQKNHVGVTTIERLDQGHLYPLGERRDSRGANLRHLTPQATTLPKELSRQLIRWLFGTSTCPESAYQGRPLQMNNR